MKKKIAVLGGGYSSELVISLKSIETVLNHLDKDRYEVYKLLIIEEGWFLVDGEDNIPVNRADFSVEYKGEVVRFDFVYITVHGTPGEDGLLQAYFDLLQLPYNTPSHIASTLTFNKWANNQVLKSMNIPCADSVILRQNSKVDIDSIAEQLGLPCFVKPNDGGSSFGVTKVKEKSLLAQAIQMAFEHGSEVLIESEMIGTEVTCGIYNNSGEVTVLSPTEIVTEQEFFNFEAKYEGKSQEITPARVSDQVLIAIQSRTKEVYQLMGLKGVCRVDFIIVGEEPHVIEVNTTPGMSENSIIPQQAAYAKIPLRDLFTAVIEENF